MKLVKIVTPDNGASIGTKVFDAESGHEITNIGSLDVKVRVDDIVRVDVHLVGAIFDGLAAPSFFIDGKKIAAIAFEDGEVLDLTEKAQEIRRIFKGTRWAA